jgi:hypothetical protein
LQFRRYNPIPFPTSPLKGEGLKKLFSLEGEELRGFSPLGEELRKVSSSEEKESKVNAYALQGGREG